MNDHISIDENKEHFKQQINDALLKVGNQKN